MGTSSTPQRRASQAHVSQQRFWLRRAGALVLVGVIGYSLVWAIASSLGGEDGTAGANPVAEQTESENDADPAGITDSDDADSTTTFAEPIDGEPDPTTDDTTTTAPESETETTGPPTPSNQAKVYIVGDSDAGTFGPYLETLLDGTLVADTELNYKVSSGLARPDFFNWPEELAARIPEVAPDIIVATFGGNDSQGLRNTDLTWVVQDPVANETEWVAEYQRRAGEVMDLLMADGRTLIWVGIPNDDNPDVTARLALQDRAAKAAAAERPEVVFVDTWTRFSGRDGNWAEFVVDPRDNVGKDVRADDGFHLNVNGAEILAIDIAVEVQEALRALGANI